MQKYIFVAVVLVCVASKNIPSLKEEEAHADVPPPPLHDGSHAMQKLDENSIETRMGLWDSNDKQYIWESSGLLEGDIMEEVESRNAALYKSNRSKRWPGAVVPYRISDKFNETQKDKIRGAMDEIHMKSCVRFRPYKKGDIDYIDISRDGKGCWSFVGRLKKGQVVSLAKGCVYHGAILHELLHALGFHHQQSASNRDDFVKIHWENIKPNRVGNFKKHAPNEVTDFGVPYDYQSVMHYGSYAFSITKQPTITPLKKGETIGHHKGLSDKDAQKLNKMYNCKKAKSRKKTKSRRL